jgi:hypothetical protein
VPGWLAVSGVAPNRMRMRPSLPGN